MAYDKEKRYSIETISIYYKNANDMMPGSKQAFYV